MPIDQPSQSIAIDAATLVGWGERAEALFLDVREPEEHAAERVPGALLAPLSTLDPARVPLAAGRKLVLLCRTGRRAEEAGRLFLAAGHADVYHLPGGLAAWKEAGGKTETAGASTLAGPLALMRQVQVVAGSLTLLGSILGTTLSPWFLLLSGAVGAGQIFSGLSGTCGMGLLLAKMPWNRVAASASAAPAA